MLPSWIQTFKSYLGGSIYHTEQARYNSALAWYRTLCNLGFDSSQLVRLSRFIRYGVLNADEASKVVYGRLSGEDRYRYLLMVYYIDYGWIPEQDFYYKHLEPLWQDSPKVENITLFP